ncbi:hypothetical protein [uncultured Erythrobacter sp.]|uniref:hypothetical protein n=1 Tax=uncultured Erythrobacter sp. TaxID=263913 RepID=UPI002631517D|nr:hypothetical protein [uncultured Erythrobacter sp.]
MISAIVYGRNDNYSYALDRRTALGLNQLSRQLVAGEDEIIFVDYNTDNDLPTYMEAIGDTLAQKAIDLIRVIRVRPEIHDAAPDVGPPVREAFCRNVALRRLNPKNEWVLSTNPDCMLVSPSGGTLSALVKHLPQGYFGLPRFEIPRLVWETFPRTDPIEAARLALHYADVFALDETVEHYLPKIGYDGPGDFQLARASDLQAICGFNEEMTLGWHVDSNLNARLALLLGQLTNFNEVAGGDLALYHTEHSRRISAKHKSGRSEDPFEVYVDQVENTVPSQQETTWGAPHEHFEEFELAKPPSKAAIFAVAQHTPRSAPVSYVYGPESFNALPDAPESHLSAFLVDHLAHAGPGTKIGWLGEDLHGADRLRAWIASAKLDLEVLDIASEGNATAIVRNADLLCLAAPPACEPRSSKATEQALAEIVSFEHQRMASGARPRRVVGLNVPHSQFEETFTTFIACALTPVSSRIRFGEVKAPVLEPISLIEEFNAGPAGLLSEGKIKSVSSAEGYMATVRRPLLPGHWRVTLTVSKGSIKPSKSVIDVALDTEPLVNVKLPRIIPGKTTRSITFKSGLDGMFGGFFECRIWADGKSQITLEDATILPI